MTVEQKTQIVSVNALKIGDHFVDGAEIVVLERDGYGTWIETDCGTDVGYLGRTSYRILARSE